MKNVSLYLKEGSSDKEYHIQLEKSGDGFIVNFQYGRVGNALQSGTKTPTPENEEKAIKIFDKLEKEKRAKGYNNKGEQKNDFEGQTSIVRSEMRDVVILPQLLNTIELDEVEKLINDDRYLAQEKMDGERRLIISSPKHPIGLNKKGQEVPLSNSIIDSVKGLYILDGEIIGNIVYVFDTLAMGKLNHRDSTCLDRIQALKSYNFGDNIKIVSTAITTEEKRGLYNKLKAENKEGIVFKLKSSPYTAGRPSSGGNALKFKFQKTATFIVKDFTNGKRSVGLEIIMEDNSRYSIGKVTIPPNHKIPNIGDLVEVQYLYAYRGGAIFQPVYKGRRVDSDLTDATIKQIIFKAE